MDRSIEGREGAFRERRLARVGYVIVRYMPAGRPSGYSIDIIAKLQEYLVSHKTLGDPVPTVEGFCDEMGIGKKTLYNWADSIFTCREFQRF